MTDDKPPHHQLLSTSLFASTSAFTSEPLVIPLAAPQAPLPFRHTARLKELVEDIEFALGDDDTDATLQALEEMRGLLDDA